MAGYGFASVATILGCPIYAKYNSVDLATGAAIDPATGAATPKFATKLAPVIIDSTTDANKNTIRVLSSSKASYAIPIPIAAPGYAPLAAGNAVFPVTSVLGVRSGDLMIASKVDGSRCEVFKVTADPTTDTEINRADETATWNPNLFPGTSFGYGDMLINMGSVMDHKYSVSATNNLQLTSYPSTTPSTTPAAADVYQGIVILLAMYGKDTNGDGTVDTYDQTTPTTTADWLKVRTIRLALVARSEQYEKEVVTTANPLWDVGSATTVTSPATSTCGVSKCITLDVQTVVGNDWQHYRYKVFDTVIPILNVLWAS
jgi:type IV pilus assembly protein PilW